MKLAKLPPSRRVWIFDLDNTLHDARARIFPAMHQQINAYLRRYFGVDEAAADEIRTRFWRTYGTTLNGLMRHHGADPRHFLRETHVFPELAGEFAELRKGLGLSFEPRLVLLTATGDLDFKHPALVKGAIILTTKAVAKEISSRLPPACEVIALGAGKSLEIKHAFGELTKMGFDVVLTEGGPTVMGELIRAGLLDEMFVTLSPVLAGRNREQRLGMVEGAQPMPKAPVWNRLLSARRQDDYLFLRYSLRP